MGRRQNLGVESPPMGKLLEKVVAEAKKLPEHEQEAFAAWALADLESEKH